MATFAIDAIRINPTNDRITHVRWAPSTRRRVTGCLLRRLSRWPKSWPRSIGGMLFGPFLRSAAYGFWGQKSCSVAHADGHDGIDTDVPASMSRNVLTICRTFDRAHPVRRTLA